MSSNWAEENLQVIRTLMERAAVYRRKMAPMMFAAAVLGTVAGYGADLLQIGTVRMFAGYWGCVAGVILLISGYIVRGQALRNNEPFWTAPTWRIFTAFLPVIVVGGALGLVYMSGADKPVRGPGHLLVICWCFLYGLGLHSAGFFVAKGIRRLGWIFVMVALFLVFLGMQKSEVFLRIDPNLLMGGIFGGLHMMSGIYLGYTEKRDEPA
jgi:hypothetical protein